MRAKDWLWRCFTCQALLQTAYVIAGISQRLMVMLQVWHTCTHALLYMPSESMQCVQACGSQVYDQRVCSLARNDAVLLSAQVHERRNA